MCRMGFTRRGESIPGLGSLAVVLLAPLVPAQNWRLVWSDEFDGPSIDRTKWQHQTGAGVWGNNELEYYTDRPENSFIRDGALVIRANRESYGGREYTSARLRTSKRGDWLYGRFEIRAKLPRGKGIWPAIWMLPTDWEYGGWPQSGEIDIIELLGDKPSKVYHSLHYGGKSPDNVASGGSYTITAGPDFAQAFHTFALEWEPEEIRWYVDGRHTLTKTSWYSAKAPFPAPFDRRFHLLLNVAVGGNWPGSPDATTVFPQTMEVDYVRVYEDAGVPAAGGQLPSDMNQDGALDIADAIGLVQWLFTGLPSPLPCGHLFLPSGGNMDLLDANGDRKIDLADAIWLLSYIFAGGAPPALGTGCVPIAGCPEVCSPPWGR